MTQEPDSRFVVRVSLGRRKCLFSFRESMLEPFMAAFDTFERLSAVPVSAIFQERYV